MIKVLIISGTLIFTSAWYFCKNDKNQNVSDINDMLHVAYVTKKKCVIEYNEVKELEKIKYTGLASLVAEGPADVYH